jgi:hypothetical protein
VAVNNAGEVAAITEDKLWFYADKEGGKSTDFEGKGECVAFSPDRNRILVADALSNAHLYDKSLKPSGSSPHTKRDRSSPTSCAIANNGTAVIGLANGQVLFLKLQASAESKASELKPISELVPFRQTARVRAVSIDTEGRFIAALHERQTENCVRPTMGGQRVQLWELDEKTDTFPPVPRVSTCFPDFPVIALGMVEKSDQGWVIPLYEKRSDTASRNAILSRRTHQCKACSVDAKSREAVQKMIEKAYPGQQEAMKPADIEALYGIKVSPKQMGSPITWLWPINLFTRNQ